MRTMDTIHMTTMIMIEKKNLQENVVPKKQAVEVMTDMMIDIVTVDIQMTEMERNQKGKRKIQLLSFLAG